MTRTLELLPIPAGRHVLGVLPRLARALAGNGPALLPVPAGDERQTARTAAALAAGAALSGLEDDPDDPTAVVVPTSGSTGTPKGALLPASALLASARATRGHLIGDDPRPAHWLLALPAHHIAGLQVLQRSLLEGTEPVVLDTAAPFTAARFARAARHLPAGPAFVSLVPTQLTRILADPAATAVLAGFDAVLIGGTAAHPALLAAAAAGGVRVVTTYGMSETCGGCVYDGRPLAGVTVSADAAGRLSLAGSVIARGYRGMPGHRAFDVDATGRRRFRTDDVGALIDGRWQVLGRVDDTVITGGVKVAPAAVESTLSTVPGVAEVVVTGVPDVEWGEVLVAVVVPSGERLDPRALRATARQGHGPAAAPRAVVVVDRLPLRGPGKPDRAAIRDLAVRALATRTGTAGGDMPGGTAASGTADGPRLVDIRAAQPAR